MVSPPFSEIDLVAWASSLPTPVVYLTIAALAAVENVFPPMPADTIIAVSAYLASKGVLSWQGVFGATWFGNVASAVVVFTLGRRYGRAFFRGRVGQRLLSPRAFAAIERSYTRWGTWGIFSSRFLPMWRAVVPPFAGVAGLSARRAVPPMALASALWYGTLTYVVYRMGGTIEQVLRVVAGVNRGLALLALAVAAAIVIAVFRHRRR